jgi:hypothetical protein
LWVAVLLLCPALFVAASSKVSGSAWWQVVFQIPIGSALIGWLLWVAVVPVWEPPIIVILGFLATMWGMGATWFILLISQAIRDFQSTTKFDWLHWIGIVVVLAQIVLFVAMTFLGLNPWLR